MSRFRVWLSTSPSALGLCCGGLWAAMVLATLFMGSAPASADGSEERSAGATGSLSLGGLGALKAACREAREPGRRRLYVVELGRYHFDVADREEGFLPLDTTHNLSAFGGAAALFPSDMETIGFHASERRRRALRNARRAGARLRVGFFLGFDGEGQPCVIRPSVGVTTVRMDVAFLELVDERGRVIARDDTERLRAWSDDLQHEVVAGAGPRVGIDRTMERARQYRPDNTSCVALSGCRHGPMPCTGCGSRKCSRGARAAAHRCAKWAHGPSQHRFQHASRRTNGSMLGARRRWGRGQQSGCRYHSTAAVGDRLS